MGTEKIENKDDEPLHLLRKCARRTPVFFNSIEKSDDSKDVIKADNSPSV